MALGDLAEMYLLDVGDDAPGLLGQVRQALTWPGAASVA
jgi:hypothetical protein